MLIFGRKKFRGERNKFWGERKFGEERNFGEKENLGRTVTKIAKKLIEN